MAIEIAVRKMRAMAKLFVGLTSLWKRAVPNCRYSANHGRDGLNLHNVFRTIPRREDDVAQE